MDIKVDEKSVIVFDLDDTLYNEIDYLRSAYSAIAMELAPKQWKKLFVQMFSMYRNKENVFEYLTTTFGVEKQMLINLYRNHQPAIVPFEGVLPLLKHIKDKGGKLGIITDGRSKTQRAKLSALAVVDYFDTIVISEELGSEKPDQKNYRAIEEAFPNHRYCYIADNIRKDFLAPNTLGWDSIGLIDNGLNIHSDAFRYFTEDHLPKTFVKNIGEIAVT
ncbi:HAD family hydrolase [Zobellia galactanivorans]|uniref:Hydrolase HAD superfamily n=1 Tax=Zobellia galactanivorans (strain DSM 12802 / CCUG 47099 / CIP 106680 / NCIMB 13871 / Dsij) TaxID=63186 RepID=G0L1T6_ZOBGA|nr:HAD family hydrolase [Zobellia galactanivorans]CAZ97893.1 Hydrolase HAD superfamily [Zobellia galactanivorans]